MTEEQKTKLPMVDGHPEGPNGYRPGRWATRPLDATRKLWYRQKHESVQAYEAFMTYLTLPGDERTMKRTAEVLGKSLPLMQKWAQQWSWTTRVAGYEEHYLLLRLESVEAERDDMWVQQKALAQTALAVVGGHFDDFVKAMGEAMKNNQRIALIKPDALVRLFDTATKIQRMAVLGRIEGAAEVQERNERLAEAYSEELVELMREVQGEIGLSPEQEEKMQIVLKRHLIGEEQAT